MNSSVIEDLNFDRLAQSIWHRIDLGMESLRGNGAGGLPGEAVQPLQALNLTTGNQQILQRIKFLEDRRLVQIQLTSVDPLELVHLFQASNDNSITRIAGALKRTSGNPSCWSTLCTSTIKPSTSSRLCTDARGGRSKDFLGPEHLTPRSCMIARSCSKACHTMFNYGKCVIDCGPYHEEYQVHLPCHPLHNDFHL